MRCIYFAVTFAYCFLVRSSDAIGEGLDVNALTKIFLGVGSMFGNTVKTVDVDRNKMMGKWYQMYKAAINFDVFRTNMFCPVAYFTPNPVMGADGFSIQEAYRVISKQGPLETYKRDVSKQGPGQFWMYTEEYFYPSQFYVIKAGPEVNNETDNLLEVNETAPYDYLVVTDSNRLALMVFARDPVQFYEKYNTQVLDYLKKQQFGDGVFWNEPRAIYQGPDCNWPSENEVFARRVLKNGQQKRYNLQQNGGLGLGNAVGGLLNNAGNNNLFNPAGKR